MIVKFVRAPVPERTLGVAIIQLVSRVYESTQTNLFECQFEGSRNVLAPCGCLS